MLGFHISKNFQFVVALENELKKRKSRLVDGCSAIEAVDSGGKHGLGAARCRFSSLTAGSLYCVDVSFLL